jgi:16S rRNA G966 N2-methylase RsmD
MKHYFPEEPGVKFDNLLINSIGKYSISRPLHSEDICNAILMFVKLFSSTKEKDLSIIDATASVGGDSISFAKYFGRVISVEKHPSTFKMLNNNLRVYGFDKTVKTINADFIDIIDRGSIKSDIIYMDPPWNPVGQPWHTKLENLMLYLSRQPVYSIVNNIFAKTKVHIIVIKVPSNFDFAKFMKNTRDIIISIHKVSTYFIILCSNLKANSIIPR